MSDPASRPEREPVDVAATLRALRAAVRQRLAEAATRGGESAGARQRLLALHDLETVREPVPVSPRPGLGRLIVATRKAVFHLFLKWLTRPLLLQQNEFNEAAAQLLGELVESEERLRREVERLAAEVERLRARAAAAAGEERG